MTDRLATHLTTWKAWYAVAAPIALIAGSWVSLFPGLAPVEDEATRTLVNGLLVPVQFIAFGLLSMLFIALPARRWPTTRDLALTRGLTGRDAVVLVVVFVVSHALFWLLSRTTDPDPGQARRYFEEMNVSGSLTVAVASTVAGVILAPVCEELLYRGAILRPIHDHLARHGRAGLAAAAGILVASGAFALPHLGGSLTGAVAASYLVTGMAFGLVYVITGSMTAAMVSHSLPELFRVWADPAVRPRRRPRVTDHLRPRVRVPAVDVPVRSRSLRDLPQGAGHRDVRTTGHPYAGASGPGTAQSSNTV